MTGVEGWWVLGERDNDQMMKNDDDGLGEGGFT
jgi:hypothetical protein